MLEEVTGENKLGELESFYYACHERSLWWSILGFLAIAGGGDGDTPGNKLFYAGLTGSHLVLQLLKNPQEPYGPPIFAEFREIKFKGLLNMHPGIKFHIKISGKNYALRIPDKVDGWDNCENDFKQFTSLLKERIYNKMG